MNPFRAASFLPAACHPLQQFNDWPHPLPGITLDRVIGVAVDSRGLIYVAHRGEHPLICLRPDGSFYREVGANVNRQSVAYNLRGPVPVPLATRYWLHGLHVDLWDNVWVTDVWRHLVMKYDPDGVLVMTLGIDGEAGAEEPRFNQPTHVCALPSGEFFVTDGYGNSRVVKFNARGERLMEWGARGTGPGEFHTPHVVVLGPDGRLYVSDRENDRIQVFDQAGKLQAIWPGLHSVDGLCVAPQGGFYAAVGVDHAVVRLDGEGRVQDVWAEPGMFRYPHGIATGPDGAIYVADSGDWWELDPLTARWPRREYKLAPRVGGEGSAVKKVALTGPALSERRGRGSRSSVRS
ncbi:MAG: Sugar lactone lactonase YvrE [Verrucomicrobia bacterium]|nr:Sugar lactone lactonase YvrE [Verrucomicrobiota bacterium]